MKKFDLLAHIFLYVTLSCGGLAIYLWRFDSFFQFLVVVSIVLFYLVWAFVFHSAKGDLESRLFFEYLCVSLIVLCAAYLVFLG